jgi:hypothetical protein
MKKLLPMILAFGLCCAVAFSAAPQADKKSVKKDDAPAESKSAHKGGAPAEKGAVRKDDAPAPGPDAKNAKPKQNVKAPEKNAK